MEFCLAIRGAADHSQVPASTIRRFGRSLDRLHAVLPGGATPGIPLLLLPHTVSQRQGTGPGALWPVDPQRGRAAAEAAPGNHWRQSHNRDPVFAGIVGGLAIFRTVRHQPAAAIVARRLAWQALPIQALRAFQRRFTIGPTGLPGGLRAVPLSP